MTRPFTNRAIYLTTFYQPLRVKKKTWKASDWRERILRKSNNSSIVKYVVRHTYVSPAPGPLGPWAKRVLSIYELKSLWVNESMSQWVYESMSQRVSAGTQTHKMKAKISECLGLTLYPNPKSINYCYIDCESRWLMTHWLIWLIKHGFSGEDNILHRSFTIDSWMSRKPKNSIPKSRLKTEKKLTDWIDHCTQ